MGFRASLVHSDDLPPETLERLRLMIGQLPIVWALREGGAVRVPVAEVDATGPYVLALEVDQSGPAPVFVFRADKKN